MKRLLSILSLALLSSIILFICISADEMEIAGNSAGVIYVENTVQIKSPGSTTWTRADVGDILLPGTHIKTGEGATAALLLTDKTTIKLAENSEFVLVDLRETEQGNLIRKFQLLMGRVWSDVTPMGDSGSTFEIDGPDAVAAVRGTAFEVDATGEATDIRVWEGKVESLSRWDGQRALIGSSLNHNYFSAGKRRHAILKRFSLSQADPWQAWNLKNRKLMHKIFSKYGKRIHLSKDKLRRFKQHFKSLPPPARQRALHDLKHNLKKHHNPAQIKNKIRHHFRPSKNNHSSYPHSKSKFSPSNNNAARFRRDHSSSNNLAERPNMPPKHFKPGGAGSVRRGGSFRRR